MTDIPTQESIKIAQPLKLGFLGVGWIGRHRMRAILSGGLAQAAMIVEPSPDMMAAAAEEAKGARHVNTLKEMLTEDLDGIVIATPSAIHAEQSIEVLRAGKAVFCQKPLGRTGREVRAVVDAARRADRLLGVDLSYRHTAGMQAIKNLVASGEIGEVFAVDLTFHNAYGPDKPWFYDRSLSGGGCVMDLGIHLIDLALWTLNFPKVMRVSSDLRSRGKSVMMETKSVEDYAVATLELAGGTIVRIACSWGLPAGRDSIIEASFYGTGGGAGMRNIEGSFYDFATHRFDGTGRREIGGAADEWGGRAAIAWVRQLKYANTYDSESEKLIDVANVIDRIYSSAKDITGVAT